MADFDSPIGQALLADTEEVSDTMAAALAAISHDSPLSFQAALDASVRAGYTSGIAVGLRFAIAHPSLAQALLSAITGTMKLDNEPGQAELDRCVARYREAINIT